MTRRIPAPYRLLAEHYDEVFTFANPWREEARERILASVLKRAKSCCDLACGTGSTAVQFARAGLKVYAVDLSPAMCELTRAKAARERVPVEIIESDMRRFRLPEKVDLITCEFDAINHLPKRTDLSQVARSAARALKPGGHFYFDVNTPLALEEVWPLTWWIERPNLILVMHGEFDPGRLRAWTTAEFFTRNGDLWERSSEYVEEVCWSDEEIRATLHAAGFDKITTRDGAQFFSGYPFVRRGHRTFYLARLAKRI